ncbi:MAG: nitrite/sulfite reductase [Vallitaleaceae bacterium]|nr:nitrite/sulfite reductase [Vallitaleaceae bacterium]
MQFKEDFRRRSEEEYIKDQGLLIDYDEIARKGKMSKEEALISKWYGVYQSRQPGTHMARIVLAGGKFSASQARVMAKSARKYANNLLSITTRQAVQLHFLTVENIPEFMRDLNHVGLTTYHGCGDVTRTIAACPLAETCLHSRINVLPHAAETAKYLTDARDLDNLPRKFKITFSGCEANCAQPYMNCVGVIAVQIKGQKAQPEKGFKVVIGGGMGWKAFVAQELFSFVPEASIKEVCRAIALFYRDHGDRYNRTRSRLKFVVDEKGIDFCRDEILKYMLAEKFSTKGIIAEPIEYVGSVIPIRPLTEEEPVGIDGLITVRALVPKGEILADQLERLAELSEMYGNQNLYTDNRQNIAVHGIEERNVDKVREEIEKIGLRTRGSFGLRDLVSCVGKTYCPKAVTFTRELFDSLSELTDQKKYDGIEKKGFINITGCPNSCSPYRISDIGFRGLRVRNEDSGSVEGYEMLIGGDERKHGEKLGEFKKDDCVRIVQSLLDWFLEEGQQEELLGDFFCRIGLEGVKERVLNEI